GRSGLRRRDAIERGLLVGLVEQTSSLLQLAKPGAARNAKDPRSKELGHLQPGQFPVGEDQNFLEHVVGVRRPDEAAEVATERPLDTPQQELQSFPVAALGSQDPECFLARRVQLEPSCIERLAREKEFGRCRRYTPQSSMHALRKRRATTLAGFSSVDSR